MTTASLSCLTPGRHWLRAVGGGGNWRERASKREREREREREGGKRDQVKQGVEREKGVGG